MSDLETGSKVRQVSETEELGHAPVGDPDSEGTHGADDADGSAYSSDAAARTLAFATPGDASEFEDGAQGAGAFGSDPALLAGPPVDGGLAAALAPKPERPKMTRATAFLGAAALLCVGFLSGVLVERHYAGTSSPAASSSSSSAPGGSSGGSTVNGTVTAVDGDTIYVTAPDGTVYTITASGSTTVSITQIGGVSDLKPGQSVTIKGTDTGQGTFAASSITASGYGSAGEAASPSAGSSANPGSGTGPSASPGSTSDTGLPTGYPTSIADPQGTGFPTDLSGQ